VSQPLAVLDAFADEVLASPMAQYGVAALRRLGPEEVAGRAPLVRA
jgi:hypothetical protein